jgi:hypothetical protein
MSLQRRLLKIYRIIRSLGFFFRFEGDGDILDDLRFYLVSSLINWEIYSLSFRFLRMKLKILTI